MNIIIREVEKTDNLILSQIIRNVFEEHGAPKQGTVYSDPTTDNLYELFRAKKSVLWVAVTDGKITGCCGIYPTNGLPEKQGRVSKITDCFIYFFFFDTFQLLFVNLLLLIPNICL